MTISTSDGYERTCGGLPDPLTLRTPGKQLDCVIESRGEMLVIRPIGELDVSTAKEFAIAASRPAKERYPLIVLDLRELEFCDSSGLSVILDLALGAPPGSRFEVIPGPGPIRRLLAVSGVEPMLQYVEAADLRL